MLSLGCVGSWVTVVYWLSAFVDGFTETKDKNIQWAPPSQEIADHFNDVGRKAAGFLLGWRMRLPGYAPCEGADRPIPGRVLEWRGAMPRELPDRGPLCS
jgi:hypothetical protein